jgi:glucosamine-6-phosphate deaminase
MNGASALFTPDVKVAADGAAFSELSASFFIASLEKLKNPLVVLPTGNTPLGMYDVLATKYAHRRDLWDQMRFLQLDEYAGLQQNDHRLFAGWLSRVFLDRVGILAQNRTLFQSDAADPVREIARMNAWLAVNGPVDLAVLGLGGNGHLGMNEPGSSVNDETRIVALSPATIKAGAAYWGSEAAVPRQGYTLGLQALLQAREVLLLVNGAAKAGILARTLNDPVDPSIPATALRTRAGVSVIADRAAKPGP